MNARTLLLLVALSLGCAARKNGSDVTAQDILNATSQCTPVAGSNLYATDAGVTPSVQVCELPGAVFWHSDMDVDCDGGKSTVCMSDPSYQPGTSAIDSHGNALDASTLPFVVVPLPGNGLDYAAEGIQLGAAAIVVYQGKIAYGVFGDEGPPTIIGEASYALAQSVGVNPDPVNGGVDTGVTFVVFRGSAAVVAPIESHDAAVAKAKSLAKSARP